MPLFKKKTKDTNSPAKKEQHPPVETVKNQKQTEKQKKIVKKKKFGIRHKKDRTKEKQEVEQTKNVEPEIEEVVEEVIPVGEEEPITEEIEEKKPFAAKKKKPIVKKDMKNKPVYLEDTGEKLGIVFDMILDKDKNIVGYKIKDGKSDAILSFPVDQFDFSKDGLIFLPGWYTNSLKIIEKLEFKDKISPELTALLSDDAVSNEELYEIFVKHDDEMVDYINDAKSLQEMLSNRLKVLEKQRLALKDDLMDLTEKRLIKDIDRRQFSEDVMEHRRKVNILDLNIGKCKDLIKRLDHTSFGVLGKSNLLWDTTTTTTPDEKPKEKVEKNLYKKLLDSNLKMKESEIHHAPLPVNDEYKDRYFELKNQYKQLEEDYLELKVAVDKLLLNKE